MATVTLSHVKKVYGNSFADGDENALIEDFHSELSGGELKYALAEQEYDQTAMDAATLQKEHEGMWATDTKITDTLRNQYLRAEKEIMRDLAVDFQARSAKLTPSQRKEAWKQEKARGHTLALERSKRYMADLRKDYDKDVFALGSEEGESAFDALIDNEVCHNRESGIFVFAEARPYITQNHCFANHHFGLAARDPGTHPDFVRNTCYGNMLSEDEQWRKLERVVEVAGEVWR